ncbi:MAG TPA: diguanylate cyclase [Pseudomonas sp.]|nr:diguanylate cyclase [Pseudomonas sp. RW405]TFW37003.1 diguanylate cyclase [Pseudomonas putida]HBK48352.1 diguanylate cyclase [Pseudomonas sp.]
MKPGTGPVGAGVPAKNSTRWLAPAAPVFAGMPAPTGTASNL